MNSQHQIILNILSDKGWHCTSEMRSEYMADPPKRLQELRDVKGYKFESPQLCRRHNHRGGVKAWKLRATTERVKVCCALSILTEYHNEGCERKQGVLNF